MYQQIPIDVVNTNKLSEMMLRSQDFSTINAVDDCQQVNEPRRVTYESLANSSQGVSRPMSNAEPEHSSSLFVVIPRTEYDFVRHELVDLKKSINQLKSRVQFELKQLQNDSHTLKQRVNRCPCATGWNNGKTHSVNHRSANWIPEGSNVWDISHSLPPSDQQVNMCSPSVSSPDQSVTEVDYTTMTSYNGHGIYNSLEPMSSMSERTKLVQLLPNYDVWVNRLNMQIIVNEAPSRKHKAALFVLRRIIPLVFTWDELACSRGQGLNCKTTEDVFGKLPLNPVKVAACKAFMRKCCADNGCPEPSERAVNQTFSHQVNYARRRLKPTNIQSCAVDTDSKQFYTDQNNGSLMMLKKELDESEKYIQM